MAARPDLSYCGEIARLHDRNRYLCALYAPADIREDWFALFAFHYEIAHIARTISEEMVGFVRYAWWRETLDAVFDGRPPRGHPVAEALASVVRRHSLLRESFETIIDAHEKALVEKQELDASFLRDTSGMLLQLCNQVAGSVVATEKIMALGLALGSVEAAGLRSMDAAHAQEFLTLAHKNLAVAGNVGPLFTPVRYIANWHMRRLAHGRPATQAVPLRLMFGLMLQQWLGKWR